MPRPKRHIFVCGQSRPEGHPRGSCASVNAADVMDAFLAAFQERDLWGTYKVSSSGCIGPCFSGPSVLVYPEGVMYAKVRAEDVGEIIDKHIVGGEVVDRLQAPADVW